MDHKRAYKWTEGKDLNMARIMELLQSSVTNQQFTNDGPGARCAAAYLHKRMRLPADRAVLLAASGTAALHAMAAGYNILAGRTLRWATQAMTFPSAVLGPLRKSIVVDNDLEHHGPCLKALDRIVDEVDGIVVTNMFGFLCDVGRYVDWCRAHGKLLLFDNAATPMSFTRDGTNSCALGDGAFISLHETKPWGRGEGGAVVCPTGSVAAAVHRAMNFGFEYGQAVRVSHSESSNWRMSDIAAAFIQSHIEILSATGADARVWAIVLAVDAYLSGTRLQWVIPVERDCPFFPACLFLRVRDSFPALDEDSVQKFARSSGIEAKQYYLPLTDALHAPVAWAWYSRVFCLPMHWKTATADEVTGLVRALDRFLEEKEKVGTGASA